MERRILPLAVLFLLLLCTWWVLRERGPGFRLLGCGLLTGENLRLELFYSTRGEVEVHLLGPGGGELDNALLRKGASPVSLLFSPKGVSPQGGTYRLLFLQRGRRIAENRLTFSGPGVEVGEVRLEWRGESLPWDNLLSWAREQYPGRDPEEVVNEAVENLLREYPWADRERLLENRSLNYFVLRRVGVELLNKGDLPCYVRAVELLLDNTPLTGREVDNWLEPGRGEWGWEREFLSLPGRRTLRIRVLEDWGRVLVEDSRSLSIP
jgi:hypothetical protein